MHPTALSNAKMFFETYGDFFTHQDAKSVLDIGSQDVNGSLRTVIPSKFEYTGVDFVAGKGVDVVIEDPYQLPFEADKFDVVVCSSCLEHSELFWLVFLEMMRVLKPLGLLYLNVPSNGSFHRYPVDCWRFYPDSGAALVTWARRNSIPATLVESYISNQKEAAWNDFVGVFIKDESHINKFPQRITETFNEFRNGYQYAVEGILNYSKQTQDQVQIRALYSIASKGTKPT